jgi:hypothetical protein
MYRALVLPSPSPGHCARTGVHTVSGRVLAAARTAGGGARQARAAGAAARGAAEAVDDEPLAIVGERGPARAKFFHLVQVRLTYPNPFTWPRRARGGSAVWPAWCGDQLRRS